MRSNYTSHNIRSFIGAKNYNESRKFYAELGYEESIISKDMSLFQVNERLGFYLQDYYVKDWVNNSMLFLEVENLDSCLEDVKSRNLVERYKYVRLSEIVNRDWGREFFLHDPSGILWHFGQFNKVD